MTIAIRAMAHPCHRSHQRQWPPTVVPMGTTVDRCVCCGSPDLESSTALWMPFVSHRAMDLPPLTIDRGLGLATIPEGRAYALCKSLMCRRCGHLFADYRFSDSEMDRLYADYRGDAYSELRELYEPGYSERNRVICEGISYMPEVENFLADFVPENDLRVLDWGGDTGTNTPFADRRIILHIFDPSAKETELADSVAFSNLPTQEVEYDLIVLSNVLEHMPFPAETLNAIRPFMTSETTLYVEVPLETLQQGVKGPPYSGAAKKKHWHEHINFFTPTSMEILLDNSGLSIASRNVLDHRESHEKALGSAAVLLQYACKTMH